MFHCDRKHSSRYIKFSWLFSIDEVSFKEIIEKWFGIDRGTGNDNVEVLSMLANQLCNPKNNICVERSLVRFINHKYTDIFQRWITLCFSNQSRVSHEDNATSSDFLSSTNSIANILSH